MLVSLRPPFIKEKENFTQEEREFLKDLFFDIRTLKLHNGALHIEVPKHLSYSIVEDTHKYTDFSIQYESTELMQGTIYKGAMGNLYDIQFLKENINKVIDILNNPVPSPTTKKSIFSAPPPASTISEQQPTPTFQYVFVQ